MSLTRRHFATATAGNALLSLVAGCAQKGEYEPVPGQAGKDVIWVPTPDVVVERMLDMAEVKAGDRVVDLGSGDGKITIAAARRGAQARGIEYNPAMVALSRRNAQAAGVNATFEQGDIFKADFSDADVVTLYLLPSLNERLRPILLKMKPGTRVTSHQFDMGEWEPDRSDDLAGRIAHLWIVPARVAGSWAVQVEGEPPMRVNLQQVHQKIYGHAIVNGRRVTLDEPKLRGAAISFGVGAGPGAPLRFEGTAGNDGGMTGSVASANGPRKAFSAARA